MGGMTFLTAAGAIPYHVEVMSHNLAGCGGKSEVDCFSKEEGSLLKSYCITANTFFSLSILQLPQRVQETSLLPVMLVLSLSPGHP